MLLDIPRSDTGAPLDDRGVEITVDATVKVVALGYGAAMWMTQGTARVVSLGPKRAEIAHPGHNGTYRVHYATLRVVKDPS